MDKYVLAGLLAVLATYPASAASVTYDCSSSFTLSLSKAAPDATVSVTCPKFPSSLGTLRGLGVLASPGHGWDGGGMAIVRNNGTTAIDWSPIVPVVLRATGGPLPGHSNIGNTTLVIFWTTSETTFIAPGETTTFELRPQFFHPDIATTAVDNPAPLGSPDGFGSFQVPVAIQAWSPPGSLLPDMELIDFSVHAGPIVAQVNFGYDPIPEPEAFVLSLSGLTLMAVLSHRSRRMAPATSVVAPLRGF